MTKLIKYSFLIFVCFIEANPFESTYEPLTSENILIRNANMKYDKVSVSSNLIIFNPITGKISSQ